MMKRKGGSGAVFMLGDGGFMLVV